EDLAQAPVDADELAVKSYMRHARAGELEGAPVALLALAQRGVGLLARGDVVEHRDGVERSSARVALHGDRDVRPDRAAVLAQVALLELDGLDLAFVELLAALVDGVAILGMRDL